MGFPPFLSLSVGGKKHKKEMKSALFLSYFFSSIISCFSNNRLPCPSLPFPLLAASTCTSLPYTPQALLSSLSFTSLFDLIASHILLSHDMFQMPKCGWHQCHKNAHQAIGVLSACHPKTPMHSHRQTQSQSHWAKPLDSYNKLCHDGALIAASYLSNRVNKHKHDPL